MRLAAPTSRRRHGGRRWRYGTRSTASAPSPSLDRRLDTEPVDFQIGDVVQLRKPHACGGSEWLVTRLGADIGLSCQGCGRRVLLERRTLERRLKTFVARAADVEAKP